jgi:integrase
MNMTMSDTQLVAVPGAGWSVLKDLAVQSMPAEVSKRVYSAALDHFHEWYFAEPRPTFSRTVVQQYRAALEKDAYAPATVAIHISALRKLAEEAAHNGLLDPQAAAGVCSLRGPRRLGRRLGNWLGVSEAEALICTPDPDTLKGVRDQAILCVGIGCGLRRGEIARLMIDHFQQRNGRWLIVDLMGKHRRIRTVPMPEWVKHFVDAWLAASEIRSGRVFRAVNKAGRISGPSLTPQAVYEVARTYGYRAGLRVAPHDLRRTFAKLSREGGASIEQIQHSLGHSSLTTTERYLGLEQDLSSAPGDRIHLQIGPKHLISSVEKAETLETRIWHP